MPSEKLPETAAPKPSEKKDEVKQTAKPESSPSTEKPKKSTSEVFREYTLERRRQKPNNVLGIIKTHQVLAEECGLGSRDETAG